MEKFHSKKLIYFFGVSLVLLISGGLLDFNGNLSTSENQEISDKGTLTTPSSASEWFGTIHVKNTNWSIFG